MQALNYIIAIRMCEYYWQKYRMHIEYLESEKIRFELQSIFEFSEYQQIKE